MIWSLIKVVSFLVVIAGLAVVAGFMSDSGETLRIWVWGQERTLGPLQMVIAAVFLVALVWLALKLIALLAATFRFLNGDETAISRFFDRNRERKGYAAMSDALVALASGEPAAAMQRARAAERLLNKPELTTLLVAQAAEASGDSAAAVSAYKSLLGQESTRFVAVRGLLRHKLAEGDTDTALKLAEKAFALKPRHSETQDILLKLQAESSDWKGARTTLGEKLRSGALPRAVYRRRDALLALQEAKGITDEGSTDEAREAAIEANKLSPDLIPAAVIAARALVEKENKKAATKVLKKAWSVLPHPDLAAAFAEIEPDEEPEARLKRFKVLLSAKPQDEEARLTQAELLLAARDFTGARDALGNLAESHPTQRSLAILAAAERGSGAPEADVRRILSRALQASRGPQWCCDKCQTVHEEWQPICASCGGFDTLSWHEPAHEARLRPGPATDLSSSLFGQDPPLVLIAPEEEEPEKPEPEVVVRGAEDAVAEPVVEEPTLPLDEILRRAN